MQSAKVSRWLLVFFVLSLPAFAQEQSTKTTEWSWHGFSAKDQENTRVGLNWVYGSDTVIDGVQLNLIFGGSGQDTRGWQGSSFANFTARTMEGFQSSWFYNSSGELRGVSLAPLGLNHVAGDVIGLQVGGFSFNSGFRGVQLDPVASVSLGESVGAQIGSVNVARKLTGIQFGLVNIADEVTGVQFGLINISNNLHGTPIGIIDIQRNGENHFFYILETPFDDAFEQQYHSVGYRFGSKYFYKSLSLGFRTGQYNSQLPLYSAGIQIGVRLPIVEDSFTFMTDIGINIANWHQSIKVDHSETIQDHLIPETKEMLEWKFSKRFGLLCGLKQRYYVDVWNNEYIPEGASAFIESPNGNLLVQNSFFVGVEY